MYEFMSGFESDSVNNIREELLSGSNKQKQEAQLSNGNNKCMAVVANKTKATNGKITALTSSSVKLNWFVETPFGTGI